MHRGGRTNAEHSGTDPLRSRLLRAGRPSAEDAARWLSVRWPEVTGFSPRSAHCIEAAAVVQAVADRLHLRCEVLVCTTRISPLLVDVDDLAAQPSVDGGRVTGARNDNWPWHVVCFLGDPGAQCLVDLTAGQFAAQIGPVVVPGPTVRHQNEMDTLQVGGRTRAVVYWESPMYVIHEWAPAARTGPVENLALHAPFTSAFLELLR